MENCLQNSKMESNFVTINKVPTKVITLGSKIEENPAKLIIVIPGKCYNFIGSITARWRKINT